MSETFFNCLGKQCSLLRLFKLIEASFERYLVHLRVIHEIFPLQPPEVMAVLDISWYEKNSDGDLQFLRKSKGVRVVIEIAVIKRKHQGGPWIASLFPLLRYRIK